MDSEGDCVIESFRGQGFLESRVFENSVGNARSFDCGPHRVYADDGRTVKNRGCHRGKTGVLEMPRARARRRKAAPVHGRGMICDRARQAAAGRVRVIPPDAREVCSSRRSACRIRSRGRGQSTRAGFRPVAPAARLAGRPSRTVARSASGSSCGCVRHSSGRPRVCESTTPARSSAQPLAMLRIPRRIRSRRSRSPRLQRAPTRAFQACTCRLKQLRAADP